MLDRQNLSDLTQEDLAKLVARLGQPAYRARQLFRAIHHRRLRSFDEMSDLPKELRLKLSQAATVSTLTLESRYLSTDGLEILVGRAARDNDNLTFKVARPNDLWLHAADYPGSHVIVRNTTRKDIPHRTLIEAAQLAAYFSQANQDPKVDVHYTQRKFISKPKGVAPGLVRMSRFKNITVAPKEGVERVW